MKHRYFVLSEPFAKKYNEFVSDNGSIYKPAITRDGRYVNSVNTAYDSEFSDIYIGTSFPIIELDSDDFKQDEEGNWIVDREPFLLPMMYIVVPESFKNLHKDKLEFAMTTDGYWVVHDSAAQIYPELFYNKGWEVWLLKQEDFAFDENGNPLTPDAGWWRKLVNWWNS